MKLVTIHVLIVLGIELLLSRTDGEKLCSCYSFNNQTNGISWPQAVGNCEHNSKTLLVMETEREWEFKKNAIQDRVGSKSGEWFIGLEKNFTTEKWTWINGKPLTIDKWLSLNPEPNDFYGLIHNEFPVGFKGSFSSIKDIIQRGWICEEETEDCQGDCFFHTVPTSSSPLGTKAVTTRGKTSTEQYTTDLSELLLTGQGSSTTTLPIVINIGDLKNDKNYYTHNLTIVILAGLLLISSIILAVVLILLRKKQRELDSRNETVMKNQQESLPLNALNVGVQPCSAARNKRDSRRNQNESFVQQEGVYTALCSETMMTSEDDGSRTYTSLVKSTAEVEEDSDIDYVNQILVPEYANV